MATRPACSPGWMSIVRLVRNDSFRPHDVVGTIYLRDKSPPVRKPRSSHNLLFQNNLRRDTKTSLVLARFPPIGITEQGDRTQRPKTTSKRVDHKKARQHKNFAAEPGSPRP